MSLISTQSTSSRSAHKSARRRSFAIISHPDAGKTTLTEKLLLYGGALQLAGSVTARKDQRSATSDWMELERQRGISITSTVLQFEYGGCVLNLLDTPGHQDFSEDTYRVLSAVDAAIMVIDAGKGIEAQTRKLFDVCRQRGVPIFTFINKMDRPSKPPLELLDEVERVLGIEVYAWNWPLGDGPEFRGVFDRDAREVHLFERTSKGAYRAPVSVAGIDDPVVSESLSPDIHARVREELDILGDIGARFDLEPVTAGRLTPVFFGSAANNFGVQLLLDGFLKMAPAPTPRRAGERLVQPEEPGFSGFVFKIQANMNPKHRDRMAFVRVVSGRFERDMVTTNTRNGARVRLANSQRLFAAERETVDEAWAGDVVGIVGNQDFQIGDTLADDPTLSFAEIPTFAPECFAFLHNTSTAKYKRFREGLDQLLKEGVAQAYELPDSLQRVPLLGAVGPLQYEVLVHRISTEYGAECRIEHASWRIVRWIVDPVARLGDDDRPTRPEISIPTGATLARDAGGAWCVLLPNDWAAGYLTSRNPDVVLSAHPPRRRPAA